MSRQPQVPILAPPRSGPRTAVVGPSTLALTFAILTLCRPTLEQVAAQSVEDRPTTRPAVVTGQEVSHWTGLPIWGDKAREEGYDPPLPLGVSGSFYAEKQDFEVVDLTVGWFGDGLIDVDKLIQVDDAETQQSVWNTRFDTWILPFLNVYGILGYMDGRANIGLGPKGVSIYDLELNYNGPVLGVGGTLAGGFRPFKHRSTILFAHTDLNYTRTFLCFDKLGVSMDAGIDTMVLSTRVGVRERIFPDSKIGDLHLSLWSGAMYQDVQSVIPGRVEMLGLDFSVEQEARDAWNALFGGRLEIGKNFDLMVEVGLGGRQSLMFAGTFRF